MSTTGHESDIITVGGLKTSLQKFKTDHVNGKVSNVSFDSTNGKIQKTVNGSTTDVVSVYSKDQTYGKTEVYAKTETYSKEEVNSLVSTPRQNYVTVEATSSTTSVTSLLPATGSADTVYRVANWNGTQYNVSTYTEYAWNGSGYVKLDTKNVGIDTEPTQNSPNLVSSGSVFDIKYKTVTILDSKILPNSWAYRSCLFVSGKKYRMSYSGAESGKTFNAYIVNNSSRSTNLQTITTGTTPSSGSKEIIFTATTNGDELKTYTNATTAFDILVEEYDEVQDLVEKNSDNIQLIGRKLTTRTILSSQTAANNWFYISCNFVSGKKYRLSYSNAQGGKTFNLFIINSSDKGTNLQTIFQNNTDVSGSGEWFFTANVNGDMLKGYTNATVAFDILVEEYYDIIENLITKQEQLDSQIKSDEDKLKWLYTSSGKTPINNWGYISCNFVSGKKYKLSYSNAQSGKTFNVYIVNSSDRATNLQTITTGNTPSSGSKEIIFTATTNGDEIKMYTNATAAFDVLVEEYNEDAYLYISQSLKELQDNDKSVEKYIQPYKGKKILSLGDSYTWQNFYGTYLSKTTGCTQRGRGQNGGHIKTFVNDSYTGSNGEAVTETFDLSLLQQYDIITIMGGTNDYGQNTAIGNFNDSESTETVYGRLHYVLNKIMSIRTDMPIFFCTQPYRCPNENFHQGLGGYTPNSAGATLADVADAIVKFANYYGYPVFDFYHNSGWNSFNNIVTNPEASGIYPPFADNIYTLDGLHPRDGDGKGADMLGTSFGKFINNNAIFL